MDISKKGQEPGCFPLEHWSGLTRLLGPDAAIDLCGERVWKSPDFSPLCASACDAGVVWASLQGGVGLLKAADGKHAWKAKPEKGKGNRPIQAPLVHRDLVYVSKERGVYAHRLDDGAVRWHVPNLKLQGIRRGVVNWSHSRWLTVVALHDDRILLGGRADVVQVVDIRSGKVVEQHAYTKHMIENVPESYEPDWLLPEDYMALRRNSLVLGGGGIRPVLDGMQVWVDGGAVKRADAGPHHQHAKGETVCTLPETERSRTRAYVLDRDAVYIKEESRERSGLACYALSDGRLAWFRELESAHPSPGLLMAGDRIVVLESRCQGDPEWTFALSVLRKRTGDVELRKEGQSWPRGREDWGSAAMGVWQGRLYIRAGHGILCYR